MRSPRHAKFGMMIPSIMILKYCASGQAAADRK